MEKQHLEMLQLLESIEVMLKNGDSIHPDSVIRGAIQTAIGMDINLNQNKMEQTAVEWLEQRIRVELTYEQDVLFDELFDKAKAMEKEQIIEAYCNGDDNISAKQYYNETFKSE